MANDIVRAALAFTMLAMLGATLWMLSTHEIPETNREHVWTLVGVIGTLTVSSVGYWIQTTKRSDQKDKL